MSARDLQHGCVGSGESKTSRGYKKTLKTEAFKPATGNGRRLGLWVQTDSLKLTCAEEEKPHERQSHAPAEAKNPLGIVRRRCPGKHSEADKPTEGSAVSQEAAG